LRGDGPADPALGIIEIPGDNRLLGADDDAGGLKPDLYAVRAEITFGRGPGIGIDVQGVVGAGLHAGLATDAALIVEIDDAVASPEKGPGGTDLYAGGVIAVVASQDPKVTFGVGKLAFLDVFDPRPIDSDRDIVLFLAGYRAGMTADAAVLVDDETVAHCFLETG